VFASFFLLLFLQGCGIVRFADTVQSNHSLSNHSNTHVNSLDPLSITVSVQLSSSANVVGAVSLPIQYEIGVVIDNNSDQPKTIEFAHAPISATFDIFSPNGDVEFSYDPISIQEITSVTIAPRSRFSYVAFSYDKPDLSERRVRANVFYYLDGVRYDRVAESVI
jgi:hypothetical protein